MATSRRVGNYSTSAKAVVRASDQIFDAAMSGKPDFTKIYDLTSLTPKQWGLLSRVTSGEAGPGDDRYGVVASVLNRVSSDKFPGTIKDVVYQNDGKGTYQYEAFTKKTDFNDPKLTADLSSPEGQAKILKALSVLDGRTDFKGQTMLKYRSNKGNKEGIMDPMFHSKGNFYHYAHQT